VLEKDDLLSLMAVAAELRDSPHGSVISYTRKLFILPAARDRLKIARRAVNTAERRAIAEAQDRIQRLKPSRPADMIEQVVLPFCCPTVCCDEVQERRLRGSML
jgi:hypothetical protein